MQAKIHTLSEDLRNKISAGEVVERPASVIKELLENSIDADATKIDIVVEKAGQQTIQVTDNGHGIPTEELLKACERYSTSKIATVDDLFKIETLGFRGEALASIASVAEVEIESSINGKEGGKLKYINIVSSKVSPAPGIIGTQITVKNLFYNTPARRKFLKSQRVEMRHIIQMVRRFALAFPKIGFSLKSDDKSVFSFQPESLTERISATFDPTYSKNLLTVNFEKGDYTITGFVGNLNLVRSRPGEQYLFLNQRFIQDRLLNSAVYGAYQSLVNRGEYPFFVLNLGLPNDQIDVNVHPMKLQVRFKDEWRIHHVLKSSVSEALSSLLETIPDFEKPFYGNSFRSSNTSNSRYNPNQDTLNFRAQSRNQEKSINLEGVERAKTYVSQLANAPIDNKIINADNFWQIHSKFILAQISSGLVIIDQHVAHERILFEEAIAAFSQNPMASQTLLFPEEMQFAPDEYSILLEILPYLEKIGFRMKQSGKDLVLIESIPSEMTWGREKEVIRDIIDNFESSHKKYSSLQENIAASFACHAAVKAGDKLTVEEMRELVDRLFGTKHPYYCPHGRPIIVQLSLEELDKRFER
ncbi:MAG: DNA mismatch repair endonuclease MutL [Planctomycetia bacterium]|nr:DNA mismatch repair endonuclease MutL [Planctomycetia bacterium]